MMSGNASMMIFGKGVGGKVLPNAGNFNKQLCTFVSSFRESRGSLRNIHNNPPSCKHIAITMMCLQTCTFIRTT